MNIYIKLIVKTSLLKYWNNWLNLIRFYIINKFNKIISLYKINHKYPAFNGEEITNSEAIEINTKKRNEETNGNKIISSLQFDSIES